MKQDNFPKTLRGFYWLVIKKFPFYFGVTFVCGILANIFQMIFDPLIMKWITQVFENAVSANYHLVYKLIVFLICIWSASMILGLVTSFMNGHRMQIFNRYKLYLLYKRIYANDISFFIDYPNGPNCISGFRGFRSVIFFNDDVLAPNNRDGIGFFDYHGHIVFDEYMVCCCFIFLWCY